MLASRIDELIATLETSSRKDILELRATPPSMEKHDAWMQLAENFVLPLTEQEAFATAEEALIRDLWLNDFFQLRHRSLYYRSPLTEPPVEQEEKSLAGWHELIGHRLPLGEAIQDLVRRRRLGLLDRGHFLYRVIRRMLVNRPSEASHFLLAMSLGSIGDWSASARAFRRIASQTTNERIRHRSLSNWSNSLLNACEDRAALRAADCLIAHSTEPWVWLTQFLAAARVGEMSRVVAAGFHLEESFGVDSIEVQQSRMRRKLRTEAGLQRALPRFGGEERRIMMSLGEVSHCLLDI